MVQVRYRNDKRFELPGRDGSTVCVFPGEVSGELHVAPYVDEGYLITIEDGMLELVFRFCTRDGRPWRHRSVFKSGRLWPPEGTSVTRQVPQFEPEFQVESLFDDREPFELPLREGGSICGRFKYTPIAFAVGLDPDQLQVNCRFHSPEIGGFENVHYRLPLAHLLWRKAPLLIDDDELIPESTEYVDVVPDTIPGARAWAPSPVEVVVGATANRLT